jgi:acyl-CoA synthetase (NDP forming)
MLLGARQDAQFGPVVLIGFGGIHAEMLADAVTALPPFDSRSARRRIDTLRMRKLLDGQRGNAPCDIDAFCDLAARFSALVHELSDVFEEIDVNPVIVTANQCIAVDALVVGRRRTEQRIEP